MNNIFKQDLIKLGYDDIDINFLSKEISKIVVGKKIKNIAYKDDEFPLVLGSRGKKVEQLQRWLLKNYHARTRMDGHLDKITFFKLKYKLGTNKISENNFNNFGICNEKTFFYK